MFFVALARWSRVRREFGLTTVGPGFTECACHVIGFELGVTGVVVFVGLDGIKRGDEGMVFPLTIVSTLAQRGVY